MFQMGQKLKSKRPAPSSALTSTADITHQGCEVRFVPGAEVIGMSMQAYPNICTVSRNSVRRASVTTFIPSLKKEISQRNSAIS